MKNTFLAVILILTTSMQSFAQDNRKGPEGGRRFSLEELQARQKAFITEHAHLTSEEAAAFFPLFFELQKKVWETNKEARQKVGMKRGEECTEEQYTIMINEFADAKIKIAELEKEYIDKYLKVLSAKKVLWIQHAEDKFQKEMLRKMWERGNQRNNGRR